jgi:hypothetical protein
LHDHITKEKIVTDSDNLPREKPLPRVKTGVVVPLFHHLFASLNRKYAAALITDLWLESLSISTTNKKIKKCQNLLSN